MIEHIYKCAFVGLLRWLVIMFSFQYIKCGFACVRFILYSFHILSGSTIRDIIQCKEKIIYKNVAYPVGCHAICNVQHKVHRLSSDRL